MKISYRTHPALKLLDQGFIDQYLVDESEDVSLFDEFMVKVFKERVTQLRNVRVLSIAFADAANKAAAKLFRADLFDEIFNISSNTGTLILGKSIVFHKITKDETIVILFDTSGFLNCFLYFKNDTKYLWTSEKYLKWFGKDKEEVSADVLLQIIEQIIFSKYADVEVKSLAAGQKIKAIECNYKNDTKSNIKILNSTWFTTLVKSDGFNVRGHFRLQPKKKDGEWTKEIIWISEFEKHGYTAPARKLKEIT